jgi:membrane protein
MILSNTTKLLKTAFTNWKNKDPFRESSIIAYYAIFSIPGLLLLIISITGYFFGKDVVNENIINQISITMGADTAKEVKGMLLNASQAKSTTLGNLLGVLILIVGATGVFVELQKTLNIIWQVKVQAKTGIFSVIKARIFSFGMIVAIAFLLLISLVVSAALTAMSNWIKADTSAFGLFFFHTLNFLFSLIVISALFALIFKTLPDVIITWKNVWLGSLLTGLLFTIGKTCLAFYFGTANPTSIYGAAGSIVLILLWVSYSSMILFFGAEFTAAYTKMYSGKIKPSTIAKVVVPNNEQFKSE